MLSNKSITLDGYLKVVILLTIVNLALLGIRNYMVGDTIFNFLKSNLISGIIPFIIAYLLAKFQSKLKNWIFWIIALVWVLFYPNSPYMISDLIHDGSDTKEIQDLIVYDTLIIFSIAMLSVFYGFLSVKIMFNLFYLKYGNRFAHIAIFLTLALSCVGFYMGRELKSGIPVGNGYLYSSEIFTHPIKVIKIVWHALFPIGAHLPAYAMMVLFGIVQYLLIVMFKDINDIESAKLVTKA
ncbi:MAG: DUF1361 domain-containing protein [Bacteroidota bacterium]